MSSMTFQVNDGSTDLLNPAVWVTITEQADGTLKVSLSQSGGVVGDLRGVFFDVADESILSGLKINAASQDIRVGNDDIKDLGGGATMSGLTGADKGFDVGIEIGTSGIGKDDIRAYEFTLSADRALTLDDFAQVDFGVRLTSVGTLGGSRSGSSKLLEVTERAVDLADAHTMVVENDQHVGNLLEGIATAGQVKLTAFSGAALGERLALSDGGDDLASLTVNADGTYGWDASGADRLSEGEAITYTYTVHVHQQHEATSWSDDSATFTVTLVGRNDGPVANDDHAGDINANEVLTGSVAVNDTDVDRLDTHTWSMVANSFDGQGVVGMTADGEWTFDAQGAYDELLVGESIELHFQYTMTDNHGASDVANVTFTVLGVKEPQPEPPAPTPSGLTPLVSEDPALDYHFNDGIGFPMFHDVVATGFTDNDTLKLDGFGAGRNTAIDGVVFTVGDFELGSSTMADTQFVITEINTQSGKTDTTTGYLADYALLDADQVVLTGFSGLFTFVNNAVLPV